MMELRYGDLISGYSTCLQSGFTDVRLHIGSGNRYENNHLKIASFEMYGIRVQVTDQEACEKIICLRMSSKKDFKVKDELLNYLDSILFLSLQQNPSYLAIKLQQEYDRGVEDGRREKAKEIRAILLED